jgi:hypothetical protein
MFEDVQNWCQPAQAVIVLSVLSVVHPRVIIPIPYYFYYELPYHGLVIVVVKAQIVAQPRRRTSQLFSPTTAR